MKEGKSGAGDALDTFYNIQLNQWFNGALIYFVPQFVPQLYPKAWSGKLMVSGLCIHEVCGYPGSFARLQQVKNFNNCMFSIFGGFLIVFSSAL